MAQDISLWGAEYSDVPAVILPTVNSGTAKFTDVTPTTATASDVASGTYFFTSDGTYTEGSAVSTKWKVATSLSGTPYYDEQDYSTSIYFDNSDGLISNVSEIGAYIITTVTDLNSDTDWWSAVSIVHDSTGTICYWYNEYQFDRRTDVSVSVSIDGDNIAFTSTNANFRLNDNNAYKIILLYGGEGNLSFHTADYTPSSNSKTATFTIDEPYLYLCANNSNQVQDFSTMYNVTKLGDEIWGFDYDIYSDSDVSDSYSSGTLTITIDSNARPYFKKNNVHRIYYLTDSEVETPLNLESVTKTYTPSTSAVTDSITPSAGYDGIGEVDVTVSAVPLADVVLEVGSEYYTDNGNRKWRFKAYADTDGNNGWYEGGTSDWYVRNAIPTGTSVNPSTSAQTIGGSGYMMEGAVTVNAMPTMTLPQFASSSYVGTSINGMAPSTSLRYINIPTGYNDTARYYTLNPMYLQAKTATPTESSITVTPDTGQHGLSSVQIDAIPSTYVGSGVTQRSSSDLTVNGATVTAPSGYYENSATKTISSGSVTSPSSVTGTGATVSTGTNTLTLSKTVSVTPNVTTAGYISSGTAGNTDISLTASVNTRSSSDLTVNGATVTAPSGYYSSNATKTVASGTEGTPTATKGTVSNHSISVTPSVTNTAGYISGSTKTGTAVSASELVSGSQTVNSNGTYDVTNIASMTVSVSGGGGGDVSVASGTKTLTTASSSIQFTGLLGEPTSFVITSQADIATGNTRIAGVVFDGTNVIGQTITSQVTYDGSSFSKSYSSGSLTVTSSTATFQASEYKIVYTYGGSTSDIHTANVQVGSGATSITFTGLSGKPSYFSCIFKSDFSTSSGYQRVIEVANDGTNTYGMEFDSSAKYSNAHWSYSYSSGSLTISSSSTSAGGYWHQPGYYQLTYAIDESGGNLGTKSITSNGTYNAEDDGFDGYSSVTVNVSGGGTSKNVQIYSGRDESNQTSYTDTDVTLTVSKAGTYKVYWSMDRNTTSGTNGSQLYKNGTAVGSAHTSWTHNGASCTETLTFAVNDVLVVRARARSTSYYCGVSNLTIIEQ